MPEMMDEYQRFLAGCIPRDFIPVILKAAGVEVQDGEE